MAINTQIQQAVALLKAGKLVAIPTETVYGLAADASNQEAINKIFKAKGRPADHPLIVHVAGEVSLKDWAMDIPAEAYLLTKRFWPGPLTLILKRASHVLPGLTGGQDTIGIRSPAHPLTQALLQAFQSGVAAPSANRFGHISPTLPQHVREEFGDQVDLILEGGHCSIGIESTILDLTREIPAVLRLGMISQQAIEAVLKRPVLSSADQNAPKVSGSLKTHYAPYTPAFLMGRNRLEAVIQEKLSRGEKVAVIAFGDSKELLAKNIVWSKMPFDPALYAKQIYLVMRDLDRLGASCMLIEEVPNQPEWSAIRDRLSRATT